MIRVEYNDDQVEAAMRRLLDAARPEGLRPAMAEIGEHLTESTKQRFDTSTGPDGQRWEPLAMSTILNKAQGLHQVFGGSRTRGTRAQQATAGKPLEQSGQLARGIRYALIDNGVMVGTNRFADVIEGGAAVHQFGSDKAGRGKTTHIPARPFLGLSLQDEDAVLGILRRHLLDATDGH